MLSRRTLVLSGLSAVALGAAGYALWPRLDAYAVEAARQRSLLAANPALADLVRMATLAANSHNTQPWKFRLEGSRIALLPDLSRRTAVVDPDDHHLYVSLGCAAENLMIAARAAGRSAEVAVQPGAGVPIEIALGDGPVAETALYQAIPLRQSTRSLYDGAPVSAADINLMTTAARQDGVTVAIFTEPADREAVLDLVVAGNSVQMDDPAFVAELRDWIRFTPSQALATGDGLFAAASGNPVLPGWISATMFPLVFRKQTENDKYRAQIRSSAGIAVFVGDKAGPEHWIAVGRSFQRFALQATALGIRTAHVNQPVEVPLVRTDFARWLGTPEARPDLVVRFGRAPALPMSLRRRVEDVIV